uniref:Short transient receptor potential channel 4-like n=1 Tax=Saccoglossus kowalevskii TaxID=10224 RepID=A0ABM0M1H7_SACKO|nr:PREDICTED: short transient receptor potential channel 4-like [Saccoglossus kowalevskii]
MNNSEEIFASLYLNAVEEGAEDAVQYALQNSHLFDKNCVDYKGRSALILAIDNENIDMLHLLIQNDVIIDEAFLHAIDEGQYAAVEVFCKRALYLRARGIDILNCGADSSLSSCDVTPIVKAAQCNELHIIKLLLDYGAVMPDPAVVSPRSEPSSLQSSLTRLHIYQALSSEAYISLTSVDPIGDAFVLSVTLRKLSKEEYEFSQEYEEMSIRCEQFAADLLAQTRDQREIRSVLEYDSKLDAESVYDESVQRVTEAVNYRQKKFIAQAHCQQYLIGQYYKQLKNKVDTSTFVMLLTSFLISISYPVLSIIYLFWPKGKFADFIRIPYIKFLMHAMSYLTFLVLLFMTSTEENNASAECSALYTERKDVLKCLKVAELAQQQRGPPPSILELIIVLWIVGMTWREIKELWSGGVAAYLRDPYNFIDWSQLALYWAVIALRIVAYLHVYDYIPNFATADGSIISVSKRQTTDDFVRKQHNGTRVFTEEQITSVANDIIGTLSSEMQISHERLGESITELSIVLGQILGLEAISNGTTKQDDSVGFDDDTWWQDDSYFQEFQDDLSYIIPRSQWNQWDPTLIAECIFAVANVLSVLRILRLTVISQKIGPMQITLQKIVLDIFKFLFIFFCAWTAFSLGLTQIYWSYNAEAEVQCYQTPNATDCDKQPFSR